MPQSPVPRAWLLSVSTHSVTVSCLFLLLTTVFVLRTATFLSPPVPLLWTLDSGLQVRLSSRLFNMAILMLNTLRLRLSRTRALPFSTCSPCNLPSVPQVMASLFFRNFGIILSSIWSHILGSIPETCLVL